jgi:hypothetical protein
MTIHHTVHHTLRRTIKISTYTAVVLISLAALAYGTLWLFSFKNYPVSFGVSFSPQYASSLGLDWKQTYQAILDDLKPKYIRIAAPWNEIEKQQGDYSYDTIDYMMNLAQEHGTKVLLVIGQKVPRWPECYFPQWVMEESATDKKQALLSYISNTVKRYADHPALEAWQVENEPFIQFNFGACEQFDQNAVQNEINLVRTADVHHPVVITDSGELSAWYTASHSGDILGVTLYRTVRTPSNFIWKYSYMPAAAYKARARILGIEYNHFFISELQAEPWFNSGSPVDTSIATQEQTMNPADLVANIDYAQRVGASRAYFWGAEWWYFMKTAHNDPRYWDIGKAAL